MTFLPPLPPLPVPSAVKPDPLPGLLPTSEELWVVGDVHGALAKLRRLLLRAGLSDQYGQWRGGSAHVVFLGDYMDRGEDGAGTVRLIRTLQRQARESGGRVDALLGNHEAMLLAAVRFYPHDPHDDLGFFRHWLHNGGSRSDLERLEPSDLTWMRRRPAMLRVGPWLMQHADSLMYTHYGTRVSEVNSAIAARLEDDDPMRWREFIGLFTARMAFQGEEGSLKAQQHLSTFQAQKLVHGHTPVNLMFKVPRQRVLPRLYASQLCLNVDSGMAYQDAGGFIVRLSPQGIGQIVTLED